MAEVTRVSAPRPPSSPRPRSEAASWSRLRPRVGGVDQDTRSDASSEPSPGCQAEAASGD